MLSKISTFALLTLICLSLSSLGDNNDFSISVENNIPTNFSKFFHFVMAGSTIQLKAYADKLDNIALSADKGKIVKLQIGKWEYSPPTNTGNYKLKFVDTENNKQIVLTIFVMEPIPADGEYLNKYRIGKYPEEDFKGKPKYKKPKGLIEVTKENKDLYISPHFQLKQFLCKQKSGWPKYLIVDPNLILKLEYLLAKLQEKKPDINTLFIMSGYRTPFYNKAIGNVKFSRHVFGDAADVYVDVDLDGVIDDLNQDGKFDMSDAMVIHSAISELDMQVENKHLIGGVGKYKKNAAHTYFIHVDTRGYKASW